MGFQPSTVWSKNFPTYPLEHAPDPRPESPTVYDLEVFPFGGLGDARGMLHGHVGVLLDIDIQADTEPEDRCLQRLI